MRFLARLYPRAWRMRYGVEFDALLEDLNQDWRTSLDILKGALQLQMRTGSYGKLVLTTALAGALIAFGASFTWPKTYESSAVLAVKPAKGQTMADVVAGLAEQAESRNSLTRIIQENGLYPRERSRTPLQDVIEQMKTHITLSPVGGKSVAAFALKFAYDDPVKAQRVTEALTSSFVASNLLNAEGSVEVLDPSSLPQTGVSPNRAAVTGAGLALGLVAGVLLAGLLKWRFARVLTMFGTAGALAGFSIAFVLPVEYQSQAVLLMSGGPDGLAHWARITEKILSDPALPGELKLPKSAPVPSLETLRKQVTVERIQGVAIRISATDRNRFVARDITEAILSRLIDENDTPGPETARVLDPASLPTRPAKDPSGMLTGGGLLFGLSFATGMRITRRRASQRTA